MKTRFIVAMLFICAVLTTTVGQDSRQEYYRHLGLDTLSFGQTPGRYIYSVGDSLFYYANGTAVKIVPTNALSGTGTASFVPYYTGTSSLGASRIRIVGNDVQVVSPSGQWMRLVFIEEGQTDTAFIALQTTAIGEWVREGLVIGSHGFGGATVMGPLSVIGPSLGAWARIRGKLYAGDLDSGTISMDRLPPGYGIAGSGVPGLLAYWSNSNTVNAALVGYDLSQGGLKFISNTGVKFYVGSGSTDSVRVTGAFSPFGYANNKAALSVNRDIAVTGSVDLYAVRGQYVREKVDTPGGLSLDWSRYTGTQIDLEANASISFVNVSSTAMQTYNIVVRNLGSYTITWPSAVKWKGGTAPTQSASKTDIYTFIAIGGTTYGSVVQDFAN